MASISGLQNNPTNNLNTIDGLQIINATSIYENGQPINIGNLVPYNGATEDLNMGFYNLTTDHIAAANSDVVNLQALNTQLSILTGFLIDVGVLNFVPYNGATTNTNLGTNGLSAGAITANSSLTVNGITNFNGNITATSNLNVGGTASLTNLIKTEFNNVLSGYSPSTITIGNDFGTITNSGGVYQSTSTAVFASLVLGTLTPNQPYIVSLSLKSVDVGNNTNLYLYGSTTPNMTGQTGQIVAFSIPPNTTTFSTFTNNITFPSGSTYLLLVYYSQKPSGIDTLYWNQFTITGLGSSIKNLITPTTSLDAANKLYVDNTISSTSSLLVPYTGASSLLNLGSNSLTASTAKFTAITSATPSLALGVDALGNLNSFAVPSATNLLPLNNTWTGTNQFNNTLTTADGYTNNFGDAVYTGVNAITSGIPTTTGITAIAPTPLPTISFSVPTYTCTPSGASLVACFWASGTFTQNVRYFFYFTNATTTIYSATAQLTVCQANTANTAYIAISTAYNLPSTLTPIFSGYFTPNTNASYTGQVFFILSNVKFTPFKWDVFTYGIGALTVQGNEAIIGLLNIHAGSPSAVPNGYMSSGSLTIGDIAKNYGGGTTYWNSNTAGLLMECLDNTEIAVHDAGARVSSLMRYNANTITMGRDMGWGVSDIVASNNLSANCLIVNGGGTYQAGCIYSDGSWGMLYRAKVPGTLANFAWFNSVGTELMRINTAGQLVLTTADGPGLVHTNGTVIVESYIGGGGGWFGTRTNHPLRFYANNSSVRMALNPAGDMTHTAGDSSYMRYGPNGSWNSYLTVGATTDKSGASNAQVISTNGNLHLDAGGNSNAMYYGYYANAKGTPNPHYFFGTDIQFQSGLPQNNSPYSHVACLNGNVLQRSQCMMKRLYQNGSVGWGGGINNTYAFYKYNQTAVVRISGKYSGYWTGSYMAYVYVRIYSQSTGGEWGLYLPTFTNNGYNHVTVPFDIVYNGSELPATGWFDLYMANSSGYNTDGNDQMTINVQVLPVDAF